MLSLISVEQRDGTGSLGRGVAMRMPRILLTARFSCICVQRVRFIVYKALHVDIRFPLDNDPAAALRVREWRPASSPRPGLPICPYPEVLQPLARISPHLR